MRHTMLFFFNIKRGRGFLLTVYPGFIYEGGWGETNVFLKFRGIAVISATRMNTKSATVYFSGSLKSDSEAFLLLWTHPPHC